jgi:protein-S-isoprenylcysteine O-methyltransferase Ste14
MTSLLLVCFLSLQGLFIWARWERFRVTGPTPRGVRLIEASTLVCIGAGTALISQRVNGQLVADGFALTIAFASAAMFRWGCASVKPMQLSAAFSPDAPVELVRCGAFRFIRNPFYLSYILAQAVPLLASRSGWALIPLIWMGGLYWRAAVIEERKFLGSPLAQEYREYVRQTGRFVPRITVFMGQPTWM